jgi:hypothetical protein
VVAVMVVKVAILLIPLFLATVLLAQQIQVAVEAELVIRNQDLRQVLVVQELLLFVT